MSLLLRNRGSILLLMINIFIVFVGIGLVIPILPKFMDMLHITGSTIGLMVAAFSLSQLVFSPVAGRLSDKIGRKPIIVAGMLIFAVSEWMFGASNNVALLFIARILGGVGAALIMPAVLAYAADVTTQQERAQGIGFINAAITTGFIIGPGIGGLVAQFGVRVPFYCAAIAGLVAATITFLLLPGAQKAESDEAEHVLDEKESLPLWKQLALSVKEPYFISLIIIFIASFGLANFETIFTLYMDDKFGFTTLDIAYIITFGSIAGAVIQATIFGQILNKFGEFKVITTCLLGAAIFIVLTLFVHKYWLIFAVTFLVFLAMDVLRPALGTLMSKMTINQQGYVAGLNSAYTSLGNIVGPIVAGALYDVNIDYPYWVAGLVLFLCFLLSLATGRKYLTAPKQQTVSK
ncbi:tetracycline resistance MFS efflux pump [Paenibacillus montaniterrae]|uniref:Tetracycline resistance MFS efflux pump n=1 Tax=Paenibacillus montaniterrae TaxID=429341 RepID=A0A919YNM4_9BACL|nr:MFS transporter [Paenibacillus montaniterrae]GIP16815.1 tetracycline resistance MFS efflux pump [Paenibacillus montaniterrae]